MQGEVRQTELRQEVRETNPHSPATRGTNWNELGTNPPSAGNEWNARREGFLEGDDRRKRRGRDKRWIPTHPPNKGQGRPSPEGCVRSKRRAVVVVVASFSPPSLLPLPSRERFLVLDRTRCSFHFSFALVPSMAADSLTASEVPPAVPVAAESSSLPSESSAPAPSKPAVRLTRLDKVCTFVLVLVLFSADHSCWLIDFVFSLDFCLFVCQHSFPS